MKTLLLLHLAIACCTLISLCVWLVSKTSNCEWKEEEAVDISNTTCVYSENIGRRIFFHVCFKEESKVYDIRHFYKEELHGLKPQIIGVQLTESEFSKLCRQCYT